MLFEKLFSQMIVVLVTYILSESRLSSRDLLTISLRRINESIKEIVECFIENKPSLSETCLSIHIIFL